MHIFVTGGTGFFGKALLRYWSSGGEQELNEARFTLLSRNPERFHRDNQKLTSKLNVELVKGDILSSETLPVDNYTHILHAATDSTTGLSLRPLDRFNQIVNGTRNVLELARRCNKPRVLMISSGGVYGNISHLKDGVREDYTGMPDPLEAENAYSVAKRQAEHLCALYNNEYGIEYVVARCFAFIGEDLPLDAHFAIGNFIKSAISGEKIVINGDGRQVRTYMDQRDLAEWLTTLLLKARDGNVYNIGSAESVTISELAKMIALHTGSGHVNVEILNKKIEGQAAGRDAYIPNIDRAKCDLGLRAKVNLVEAIDYAINIAKKKLQAENNKKSKSEK